MLMHNPHPCASAAHARPVQRTDLDRSRIMTDNDPRPLPPEQPLPGDCCDSGCDPCVFDNYAEELAYYRQQLAQWLERHPEAAAEVKPAS